MIICIKSFIYVYTLNPLRFICIQIYIKELFVVVINVVVILLF